MKHPYLNEAKKELYKEKPIAEMYGQSYRESKSGEKEWHTNYMTKTSNFHVIFSIPHSEGRFGGKEQGQLLIRWISQILKSNTTEPIDQ